MKKIVVSLSASLLFIGITPLQGNPRDPFKGNKIFNRVNKSLTNKFTLSKLPFTITSKGKFVSGMVLGGTSLASGMLTAKIYTKSPTDIDLGEAFFAGVSTIVSVITGIPAIYLLKNAMRFK